MSRDSPEQKNLQGRDECGNVKGDACICRLTDQTCILEIYGNDTCPEWEEMNE